MSTPDENVALESAIARCAFNLNYSRAKSPRHFHDDGISGDSIDDAFTPGRTAPGDWSAGGNWNTFAKDARVPETVWIERFFTVAVQEAVHEALEWFRLDGKVLLSPHAAHEIDILDRSAELAQQLFSLIPRDELEPPRD